MTGDVTFRFQNLEITSTTLVLHFHDDETVIPLAQIKNYQLQWHLHDPVFGKKWWFLVLMIELQDDHEESAPVAFVKFNYLDENLDSRRCIERTLADALASAISRQAAPAQKTACI